MTDNLKPDVSNSVNTVFTEQRTVETQLAHPMVDMKLSAMVEAEMSEDTWYAKQQLMKPVQLAQLQWTTSQARDEDLYQVSFPGVLQSVESIVLRTLRMYAYFKMSPCFKVQINSTQFHQGQLICSFDPFTISSRVGAPDRAVYDSFYATGLPNVKIMASESDAVELCIPFVHPSSFWTTNDSQPEHFQDLGTFRITILNPLKVAEGTSPNVSVTVWVYAKDASVHVPIFDHNPILIPPTPPTFVATSGKKEKQSQSKEPKSILSSLSNGIGSVTKIAGNLATGNIGQALRSGQGLVDSLGDIFGFDYPARTMQPPKTISPVENLAVGIGESQSQRMAIDPFSLHVLDNEVAGESIESMDLLRIAQMPMLLSQFPFDGTQPQDTLLFSCPVTPTVSAYKDRILRRTYLSSISNAFCYWNGGINFDIEVVATRFHSGKLLFAFVPNDVEIPSYASAADGLPNVIVDIQQTSSTRFKVPFVSAKPLKDVQRLNPGSRTDPSPDPLDPAYSDSCIGTLVCYVQNILNYASNVSPTVEVNMYISAGDDFGLYVPGNPLVNVVGNPTFQATSGTNEIGIDLNKNNTPTTAAVLTKGQLKSTPRKHFGEQYALIDIIRRFTPLLSDTLANSLLYAVTPRLPLETATAASSLSYIQYFSYMYSAFCGSLRYKFIFGATRSQNTQVEIIHAPSISQIQNLDINFSTGGLAHLRTNAQQDCAIELEVPYYSKYNMLVHNYPDSTIDLDFTDNGFLVIKTNVTPDMDVPFDVYIAAGEDFRFIYLRPFIYDATNVGYFVNTLA